ncbi:hypothetical protein NBRC116601_23760 [Cognatishimia sp. WU-CL00825]|uniref:hypothetical protein n=1 Tax=Cognatishimia sp. WU-CL00825 TaxID=3127658 RepID=UPI0031034315
MRSITIRYEYDGDEAPWRAAIQGFITALNADPKAQQFNYQVAIADDGKTRLHWGRWDSAETLSHVQSQDYFKSFAAKVAEFSEGKHSATPANLSFKTNSW